MHAIAIVFSPVSAQAYAITHLIEVVFAICAAIFLLVAWLVVSAALRFRDRGSSVEPTQVFGSAKVKIAWGARPDLTWIDERLTNEEDAYGRALLAFNLLR